MITKILPNLYRIEVPLPRNPLKATNSYVIKTQGRNLIIDTGMNRDECMQALSSGLKELQVNLRETDFFITHLHADHLGLVSNLATDTSKIYFNKQDIFRSGGSRDPRAGPHDLGRMNGFPENELKEALDRHPGYRYGARGPIDFTTLKEGDTISIVDYLFKCVETPGHTRGHMCLYEPNKKILVAGDHILIDITPNISLWSEKGNPLNEYLESLDKVYNLDVELVLPGHRAIFSDCKGRIRELQQHHQRRADEVLDILEKSRQNAYQVASQMTWDLTYKSWDQFPASQKWFATGEAIAHLKYLEEKGKIRREIRKQRILFSLK